MFGFFEDSYTGEEDGPNQSVLIGFEKGADILAEDLTFSIVDTPGTASELCAMSCCD